MTNFNNVWILGRNSQTLPRFLYNMGTIASIAGIGKLLTLCVSLQPPSLYARFDFFKVHCLFATCV